MKTNTFFSIIFLIACLSSVHLLSLESSRRCKRRTKTFEPAPTGAGVNNVRYVRVLSAQGPDAWLQISQLVVRNGSGANIARGKPTSSSSNWPGTNPSTAVDGQEMARAHPHEFHANGPNNQWWMVDLQNVETIHEIVYYNRVDCCQNRIVGARVQLLDQNKQLIKEYTITSGAPKTVINTVQATPNAIAPIPVPTPVPSPVPSPVGFGVNNVRFVRVLSAQRADSWLQISQLVVRNGSGANIARGKPTSSSSNWPGTNPSTAVDGKEMARAHPHEFVANGPNNQWWMVDLQNVETIHEIVYYNRVDCCQNRIVGARVQLLDENKQLIKEYTITSGAPKTVINTTEATPNAIAPIPVPTPVPTPVGFGVNNVRFVRVLSAQGPDAWLQISQLVVRNGSGANIARGKPTSSSSNWPGTNPSTAVDGQEMARAHPHEFHANGPNNQWWMVDLQNVETIHEIVYYNRVDCCQNRIVGARVQLLDQNKQLIKEYTITSGAPKTVINTVQATPNAIAPIPVPTPVGFGVYKARFVRVLSAQKPDAWLQISQLVVRNGSGANIARGKPTSSSSNWPGTNPSTAVDGKEMARAHPHEFHANGPNNQWWMVDLQNVEAIHEIVYYNRVDCCQNRIVGARVQLLDENKQLVKEYTITSGAPKTVINTVQATPNAMAHF
jgi:Fe-S-cluster containining protein